MKQSMLLLCAAAALAQAAAFAGMCTATNVVVAPLTDAHWTQGAPYNDYSPKGTTVFTSGWEAGCVAIAAAQELRHWQWPWRLDSVRETSHPVLDESDLALRFDGNVPFDWDAMPASFAGGDATLAQRHAAARLVLACQSLVQMRFVKGGGEAMKNLPGTTEWFEYAGQVTPRASDANLAALRADFEFGSPVQTGINFKGYGGHEVVGLGYATGTNSVGEAKNLIWLNLGWGGGSDGWYDLAEATAGETIIKSTQLGFRPIKSVQIEPLAPVSGSDVTLNWHLPNCYTNKISGFSVAKKRLSAEKTTWTDDFSSGGKGRSSNTNEMRVANGGLFAWDGTASAIYTWDEKFMLSENSVLTYDIGSAYMSGMEARMEAKFGNGVWQTIHKIALNGGKGDGNYYSWGTMTTGVTVDLGKHAGKVAQLRIAVEYTTGGVYQSNDANMKLDNVSVSNARLFEADGAAQVASADARTATLGGLATGEMYAFSVAPTMSDGAAAVTQTVTTVIGSPAAKPTINAVSMSPRGVNLVQEGFCADVAMGMNVIDVACSEGVVSLEAFPSHQSVMPQSKVNVTDNGGGDFAVQVDATEVAAKWAGQRMILTLKATNATGEAAYKDLEIRLVASGVPVSLPNANIWTATSSDWYATPSLWSKGRTPDGSDEYVGFSRTGDTEVYIEDDISLDNVAVEGTGSFKFVDFFYAGAQVSIQTLMTEATFTIDSAIESIGEIRPLTAVASGSANVAAGKDVAIRGGKAWKSPGDVNLGGRQAVQVDGTLSARGAVSANAAGVVLSLAPTGCVSAASLSLANSTLRLAFAAGASPTVSATGVANLAGATIDVSLTEGMSAADAIALVSAGSFEGVESATLSGLGDDYALAVADGVLYAQKASGGGDPPAVVPGTVSHEEGMAQQNVVLDDAEAWAVVGEKPIFFTVPSQTNVFTVAFDAYIPNEAGTIFGFAALNASGNLADTRVRRKADGIVVGAHSGTTEMGSGKFTGGTTVLSPGEHHVMVEYDHRNNLAPESIRGTTIYIDGTNVYHSKGLSWKDRTTTLFSIGGAAIADTPTDVLAGLKVKNLTFFGGMFKDQATGADKFATLNGVAAADAEKNIELVRLFGLKPEGDVGAVFAVDAFEAGAAGVFVKPKVAPSPANGSVVVQGSEAIGAAAEWHDVKTLSASEAAEGATLDAATCGSFRFFRLVAR